VTEIHDGNFFFHGFCGEKHGNLVTRKEGSALFKEARDISKFSLSFSVPFRHFRSLVTHKRDTSQEYVC